MPRDVRATPRAAADIAAIRRWYSQPGSGFIAKRRLRVIAAAIRGLRDAPCRNRRGERAGTRELVVESHVVVYRVVPDTGRDSTSGDVEILRVLGPGQDRGRH